MKVVKTLRISKGLKQFVLANALDIDRTVYCRIENGEAPFTLSQLKLMSIALGVSLFHIVFIAENLNDEQNIIQSLPTDVKKLFSQLCEITELQK